ncbi:Peroxisomal biogenesis factor 6 [Wickerhamomyces ciferrii]|uniref:Peroxisomal ATPase PEX6 n=1 Tax=Wickerhamomyces ciferrii (strain ATCC 14091 / BCRC 22168 / CBS 111 / JCM 3599 / NBRC 0793 / NRRL Y-1031 F-60-10) TaxID=1206466 RepID=K0KQ24_WICCF|nr:Peroxisomal biogenesis factor 6 [Wickerhamomyces ciferrii]CCH43273.1 Peroxisomal biogenesis factor 6 [Wickerhamomyces ciferrii]
MPGLVSQATQRPPSTPLNVKVEFEEDQLGPVSYVKITNDLKNELFATKYLSIKLIGSDLFSNSIIYEVDDEPIEGSGTIKIVDSSRFKDISNLTIEQAFISTIEPISIQRAIISFPDEIYQLLKGFSGETLLNFLKEKLQLNIIREGDSLLTKGEVLLCEPIDQGKIDENTTITLIKDAVKTKEEEEDVNDLSTLDISTYLSISKSKPQQHEYNVRALDHKVIHTIPSPNLKDDIHGLAFLKANDLAKIGVHSGDFIEIEINNSIKLLKILTFIEPNSYPNNTIYFSPIFLINNPTIGEKIIIRKTEKKLSDVSLTEKVELEALSSPITLNRIYTSFIQAELTTYFKSVSRFVSIGDLIPIPIDTVLAESLSEIDLNNEIILPTGEPDSVAWYRVSSINDSIEQDSKQYLLDSSNTELGIKGTNSQILPPSNTTDLNWLKFLGLNSTFDFINSDEKTFTYAKKLSKLIKTSLTNPNLRTTALISSLNRNVGKSFIVENLALQLGIPLAIIDGYDVLNPGSELKTIGTLQGKLNKYVDNCKSVIIFIKHIEALNFKKDQQDLKPSPATTGITKLINEYTSKGVVFIASTNDADSLADEIRSSFRFEIEVPVPSEEERKQIFQYLFKLNHNYNLRNDVSINSLALQSAGLTPRDLISIFECAKNLGFDRLDELSQNSQIDINHLINHNPIKLIPQDFEKAINDARNKFSDSIGAPRIPNVTWDDIGGLDMVKGEILDTIDMPLKHPELFSNGVKKRSGILFYGPPGTGKTLLAKAIATNFSLNFFSVKGPELLNMYIGESEANVRKVFQRARDAKPCVVFFDELDSVAPKRGNQGDSGGVMDRIVSQLLAELDGMSGGDSGDGVFVVGATNRPDLLDEALLRPGRFDKMLYLGVSDTHEKQEKILEALTRKFKMDTKISLKSIAESCPFNFTGADFYALGSDAMLNAMTRVANDVDNKIATYNLDKKDPVSTRWWFDNVATQDDITVLVNEVDFDKARRELTPSVSADELAHYSRVRENFEGGKTSK